MNLPTRNRRRGSVAGRRIRWRSSTQPQRIMQILQIILAIILPPVGVALKAGLGKDFVINLILTLLFWLPGVIHALWVVLKK